MKIQKQLPQFERTPTLLLVLGAKEGVFYLAADGSIARVGKCKVETPHYSDNEGFYKSRSPGAVTSGSVREIRKDLLEQQFADACGKQLRKMDKSVRFNDIILFVPARLKNRVREAMPVRMDKKIRKVITGNHHDDHPFELLELLRSRRWVKG